MSKEDKWLGHTVKIIKYTIWHGMRGEVVAKVRNRTISAHKIISHKEYIVQFAKEWSFFRTKEMVIDE